MQRRNTILRDDQDAALARMADEADMAVSALLRLAVDFMLRNPSLFVPASRKLNTENAHQELTEAQP